MLMGFVLIRLLIDVINSHEGGITGTCKVGGGGSLGGGSRGSLRTSVSSMGWEGCLARLCHGDRVWALLSRPSEVDWRRGGRDGGRKGGREGRREAWR